MSALREAAQAVLNVLDDGVSIAPTSALHDWLRAALAQEKAEPKSMHPELRKMWEEHFDRCFRAMSLPAQEQAEPDLSRCPQCNGPADNGHDRSIPPNPYLCTTCMAEPAQEQAEPVADLRCAKWLDPECADKGACQSLRFKRQAALAQEQAEPLNLLDRAVQRRLAAQWGYVPAQAEPVQEQAEPSQEPVVRGAAYADALRSAIKACGAVQRDDGVWFGDDAAAKLARVLSEGIAPPRRTMVPLTVKEIFDAFYAVKNATPISKRHGLSVLEIARLVEKAIWEKNHEQA